MEQLTPISAPGVGTLYAGNAMVPVMVEGTPTTVPTTSSNPSPAQDGERPIQVSVTKAFSISCAHTLPYHQGKCRNPHGHNYEIGITMVGLVHPLSSKDPQSGMVEDFGIMTSHFNTVIGLFDHKNLNDYYTNPTAEVLAADWLTSLRRIDTRYSRVVVWETEDCCATASA